MNNQLGDIPEYYRKQISELTAQLIRECSARKSAEEALVDLQNILGKERKAHRETKRLLSEAIESCNVAIQGGIKACKDAVELERELAALKERIEKAPTALADATDYGSGNYRTTILACIVGNPFNCQHNQSKRVRIVED